MLPDEQPVEYILDSIDAEMAASTQPKVILFDIGGVVVSGPRLFISILYTLWVASAEQISCNLLEDDHFCVEVAMRTSESVSPGSVRLRCSMGTGGGLACGLMWLAIHQGIPRLATAWSQHHFC